jgi:hypothetical protein
VNCNKSEQNYAAKTVSYKILENIFILTLVAPFKAKVASHLCFHAAVIFFQAVAGEPALPGGLGE